MANIFSGGGSPPAFPTQEITNIAKGGTNAAVGMAWGSGAAKIAKALEDRKTWQSRGEGVNGEWYDPYRKQWISEADYRKQIRDLNTSLEKVAEPLIPGVAKLGEKLIEGVDKLVAGGKKDLNREEQDLLGRIKRYNDNLTKFQGKQDAALLTDIGNLNDDLKRGMDLLNAEDKAAFESELSSFEADAAKLTQEYDTRATGETERGFAEGQKAISDYEAQRLADIEASKQEEFSETARFKNESDSLADTYRAESKAVTDSFAVDSKTLGDTFLSASGTSIADYNKRLEEALDVSPERLNIFTQAADYISKAALQTRMDMLATADPRALELSAIADENAAAMMSGRISADVQANLARSSAMRALGGGFGAGSEMGRGLAARDLGLTSLDLMRQGAELNDAQRRLNYATRVEGTQADATGLLANDQNVRRAGAADILVSETDRNRTAYDLGLRSRTSIFDAGRQDAQAIYGNQLESARMAYSNNLGTMRTGAARRDNTFDTVLASNLTNIDTRTGRNLGIAQDVFNAGMNTNQIGFTAAAGNLNNRTNRSAQTLRDTWNTSAQARTGVYNERLNTQRSIYGTNVGAAGNIFTTNANFINSALGTQANTLGRVYGGNVDARTRGFDAMYGAKMNEVATAADARQKQWAAENAAYTSNQNNKNALWGNIIQAGATIAGAAVGTASGNPMAGVQIGNTVGSAANQAVSGSGGSSGGGNIFSSFGNLIGSLGKRTPTFQAPSGWNSSKGDWFNYSA